MRYLLYFFYITWYWGWDVAVFIIRHEIKGEKQYGIRTIGLDTLPDHLPSAERRHFSIYEPVNYYTATWLFDQLQAKDMETTLLDAGCGRGRVLAVGAAYGFRSIAGVDFSERLCATARQVCEGVAQQYPGTSFTITCADARYYEIPDSVGVIFLFNPFDDTVMEAFIDRVFESLVRRERPLKILYANPQFKHLWLEAGFRETASFVKKQILKGAVLEYRGPASA
ncbi:class I SAM-dependent methyltransferase [Chitinophaga japonensis]|uniref:Methyltransferase family protein n=1 Tax=Chitinophaga japonensis TaxID=104662 RepID=A0A562SIA6_CHIJA|nr:class I SAM-dependent methyltransferase [Chitinophaga japonensis]TWI80918.1 methyltransferase family protein [Chitinophaga japonensis]